MNKDNNSAKWLIVLLLTMVVLIVGYKILTKEPTQEKWEDDLEYGDISITEDEEEVETIPENIVDAYGLEYEFTKLSTWGISTYKPIGWDIEYENDFIYFIAPEDVEGNYKHTEIAICAISCDSFFESSNQRYIREYAHTNIKNHNSIKMKSSLVSMADYVTIKKNGEEFAYYASPRVEFRRESDPMKGGWEPYAQFYILKNGNEAVFIGTTGPLNYTKEIEEIGKTLAYNTENYIPNKFDLYEFTKQKVKKVEVGNMYYSIKEEAISSANENIIMISPDITNYGYNSFFSVYQIFRENNDEEIELTEDMMETLANAHDTVYKNNAKWFQRKDIRKPEFSIIHSEPVQMFGVVCKKVEWYYKVNLDSTSRKYMAGILPKSFTTYIVPSPDGNNYYFTINYTTYQKAGATAFLDKVMQSAGFTLK